VAVGLGWRECSRCGRSRTAAPIDDLVLWSVPARGSLLLREMRAFAPDRRR